MTAPDLQKRIDGWIEVGFLVATPDSLALWHRIRESEPLAWREMALRVLALGGDEDRGGRSLTWAMTRQCDPVWFRCVFPLSRAVAAQVEVLYQAADGLSGWAE